MPTYIMTGSYSDQGMRQIRDAPGRIDRARALLREMGGDFKEFFLTMGSHDFVVVYEAPDDAVSARFSLMLGTFGNVRTETLKAFPESAFREIIKTI